MATPDYSNLIYVHLPDGAYDLTKTVEMDDSYGARWLVGVDPSALSDLTGWNITDHAYFPLVRDASCPELGQYQSYTDPMTILSVDVTKKMVLWSRPIRDWTAEEIRAWQLSMPRMVSMRGLHYRFTDDERVALAEAMADKPGATAEEQHAITTARVLHDAVFWDRYGLTQVDLNHPGFQASVQKMEAVGLIAAGRADQILWIDPLPHETE